MRYLPEPRRLLIFLVAVGLIVGLGLLLDEPLLYVLVVGVVALLLMLDALGRRGREPAATEADELQLDPSERRVQQWLSLVPFAAGFIAAELVDGEGESIAAFSGAFVIGLVATETLFALWVNRRRAPGEGRRVRRSA